MEGNPVPGLGGDLWASEELLKWPGLGPRAMGGRPQQGWWRGKGVASSTAPSIPHCECVHMCVGCVGMYVCGCGSVLEHVSVSVWGCGCGGVIDRD